MRLVEPAQHSMELHAAKCQFDGLILVSKEYSLPQYCIAQYHKVTLSHPAYPPKHTLSSISARADLGSKAGKCQNPLGSFRGMLGCEI